jgi:hypothetical protein
LHRFRDGIARASVGPGRGWLLLERYIHDWEADGDKRVAAEDISGISKEDSRSF